jgi:ABC-type Mn2+/Zn2+ transport system permease subunit
MADPANIIITSTANTNAMTTGEIYSIILAITGAAAAGVIGSFALMKKTVIAGDVMSHIAIPGLGLAIIWSINPIVGGGATLLLGSMLIWHLEKKAGLSTEAAIGVIFSSSVALGALLIGSKEELVDALFGGFGSISTAEFAFGMAASIAVIVVIWMLKDKLIIGLFSPELASATKISVSWVNLWFLLLFSLTILSGLRFLGALLAGSLIIVPASAARQLTHSLNAFILTSTFLGILSVVLGFLISRAYNLDFGPTVVVVAAAFFALSLLKKKR